MTQVRANDYTFSQIMSTLFLVVSVRY